MCSCHPGAHNALMQTRRPPELYTTVFHTDTRLYTLMMVDLDVPDPENQSFTSYLHWLQYVTFQCFRASRLNSVIGRTSPSPRPHNRRPFPSTSTRPMSPRTRNATLPITATCCSCCRKRHRQSRSAFRSSRRLRGSASTSARLRSSMVSTGRAAAERICGGQSGTKRSRTFTNTRSVSFPCMR